MAAGTTVREFKLNIQKQFKEVYHRERDYLVGKITDASDDDLRRSLAVNVEAPFRLCRAAIPIMAAQGGGAIVNTASCWGVHPGPDHPIYIMTKAAVASLTQCLGRDHAHQNIRVNAVCPNEVNNP